MKYGWKNMAERGSMMVEALAMLGLITMVTPVLYKKAAERTTELQDINTATQMRTLSKALDDYIADNYDDLSTEGELISLDVAADLGPYLPYNFNASESKLFSEYQAVVRHDTINEGTEKEHAAFTGMVLAKTAEELPRIRASKIASMVGANGGVVVQPSAGAAKEIQGVQGGWGASLSELFADADIAPGSLVTSSVHAVTASGGGGVSEDDVLFRTNSKGPEYNTMQTTLYMGENSIEDVHEIIAAGSGANDINLKAGTVQTSGNLNVADGAAITNLLTAGSAKIAGIFNVDSAGVTSDKKVTITAEGLEVQAGGANITGDTSITGATTVTGATTITGETKINTNVKVGTDGLLTAGKRAVVSGGTAAADSSTEADFALVTDGSALIKNNAHILGDMRIEQALSAESLYGRTELGGGLMGGSGGYNFLANKDNVRIQANDFQVGNTFSIDGREIVLEGDAASGTGQVKIGGDKAVYLTAGDPSLTLDGGEASLAAAGAALTLESGKAHMTAGSVGLAGTNAALAANANGMYLGRGHLGTDLAFVSGGPHASFTDTAAIVTGSKGTGGIQEPKLALEDGNVKTFGDEFKYNDTFVMNDDNIVFDDANATFPASADVHKNRDSGVLISRKGIIQLPAASDSQRSDLSTENGVQDVPGYIKLDRMLANQALDSVTTKNDGLHFDAGGNVITAKYYDAYQVNPAYTSVMHDIKLTTRGGARLSDILPDFINKGIYVLDNTYQEEDGKKDWNLYTVDENTGNVSNGPSDCPSNDADCIASPWLGFVPAPQCPPGYSKVITISPIRWKMSEAYYISGAEPSAAEIGKKFRAYFMPLTNPLEAKFELSEADGSAGNHTHTVKQGWPLTFQTNTWLNTTVSGIRAGSSGGGITGQQRDKAFLGWHAIMGFLYYGSHYQDWLTRVGANAAALNDKVIWNLFPVYNQEMTAIANVYCYFERRDYPSAGSPVWVWNSAIVDGGAGGYNQLGNFRYGFE